MISIITAVYNQLPMNKIFVENLKKYTKNKYELIIIDNGSTDGSPEFFESQGAKVIRNNGNYSYPYCQNKGIDAASFEVFAFLNNDIIVSPEWDDRLLKVMEENKLDICTSCGVERLSTKRETKKFKRKWIRIKNILSLFGSSEIIYRLMHKIMYWNWKDFSNKMFEKFGSQVIEGFVGNTVMMKKRAIDIIGKWDERIQGADFDLYIKSKQRYLDKKDIKPVHIALGVFNHHYIRITAKQKFPPFADIKNLISLEAKWGKEYVEKMLKEIEEQ